MGEQSRVFHIRITHTHTHTHTHAHTHIQTHTHTFTIQRLQEVHEFGARNGCVCECEGVGECVREGVCVCVCE